MIKTWTNASTGSKAVINHMQNIKNCKVSKTEREEKTMNITKCMFFLELPTDQQTFLHYR